MSNYAQDAIDADAMLTEEGQQITVTRYAPSRNAATAAITKGVATNTGIAAAVEVPVTQGLVQSFETRLDPDSLVAKTMRAFKVSALLGFKPLPNDVVTLADGMTWPVVGCTSANPAGTPIVYTVGVAK